MSTTTYPAAPSVSSTPENRGTEKKNTGWIVATITAAGLALVGMIAAILMAFAPASTPTPAPAPAAHHATVIKPAHHTVTPAVPVHPKVTPSASIELLQRQLGELNYYEGPINGYDTPATIQAITYLQRDAHLPQTGQMNAATQAALTNMIASGSNIMGGGN